MEALQLEFSTIKGATENFSPANKLGEGGFGVVYKVQCIGVISHKHITSEIGASELFSGEA